MGWISLTNPFALRTSSYALRQALMLYPKLLHSTPSFYASKASQNIGVECKMTLRSTKHVYEIDPQKIEVLKLELQNLSCMLQTIKLKIENLFCSKSTMQ